MAGSAFLEIGGISLRISQLRRLSLGAAPSAVGNFCDFGHKSALFPSGDAHLPPAQPSNTGLPCLPAGQSHSSCKCFPGIACLRNCWWLRFPHAVLEWGEGLCWQPAQCPGVGYQHPVSPLSAEGAGKKEIKINKPLLVKLYCVKLQDNEREKVKGSGRVKMLQTTTCSEESVFVLSFQNSLFIFSILQS